MSTLAAVLLLLGLWFTFGLANTVRMLVFAFVVLFVVGFLKVALSVMFLWIIVALLKPIVTKRRR